MKRLVSRVLARRVVAEVEQVCGLKMPLESTRQLVEQQKWEQEDKQEAKAEAAELPPGDMPGA